MTKGFAVLALVAVFLLGACGGDDSDETEADGDTTDATAEGEPMTTAAPTRPAATARRAPRKRPWERATRTKSAAVS